MVEEEPEVSSEVVEEPPPLTDNDLRESLGPILRTYASHLMRGRQGKRARYRELFPRRDQRVNTSHPADVRYPWGETCAVLDEISRLRDDAINTSTREHMLADDEMADANVDDVTVQPALPP